MKKSVCDHCEENRVPEYEADEQVTWCERCIREDYGLLNSLALVDTSGDPMVVQPNWGTAPFHLKSNRVQIITVPKRKGTVQVVGTDTGKGQSETVVVVAQQSAQPFDSTWFEHYNSLDALPGRRHYE